MYELELNNILAPVYQDIDTTTDVSCFMAKNNRIQIVKISVAN